MPCASSDGTVTVETIRLFGVVCRQTVQMQARVSMSAQRTLETSSGISIANW
jgi:hypothetical protein